MRKAAIVLAKDNVSTAIFLQNEMEPTTNLYVSVEECIDPYYARRACEITRRSHITPERGEKLINEMYVSEHSPIRCKMFWIEVHNCPTYVATHFVRHSVGITHFQETHRSDITGVKDEDSNRLTPTNFAFICNAQSLINMAHERLCSKASSLTMKVMSMIKEAFVKWVDPALGEQLVRKCVYRHCCPEEKSCGYYKIFKGDK